MHRKADAEKFHSAKIWLHGYLCYSFRFNSSVMTYLFSCECGVTRRIRSIWRTPPAIWNKSSHFHGTGGGGRHLPESRALKLSKGFDICKGSALSSQPSNGYCTNTHADADTPPPAPNSPSHEVSGEDQEMMKQLRVLYKMPFFWSHPPTSTSSVSPSIPRLLSHFSDDAGRIRASLKMKQNKQMRLGVLTSLCNPLWNMTSDAEGEVFSRHTEYSGSLFIWSLLHSRKTGKKEIHYSWFWDTKKKRVTWLICG